MNGKQLKNSILQWAIQGKLVPQDPNDEPASVLLERIRAEKAQLIKEGKIKKDKNETIIFRGDDNSHYEKLPNGEVRCIDDEIPFEIPDSWMWCRLRNVQYLLTDGTHNRPEYTEQGIPFVSVKDISQGHLDLSNTKYISLSSHKELSKRCNPQKGDLLISKVGTTGVPVIIDTDEPFSLFVSVALMKYFATYTLPKFLIYLINSPLVQTQVKEHTRGVGNKNWVLNDIYNTLIVLPPIAEQQRIVCKIDEMMPIVAKYNKSQKELDILNADISEQLKKSILQEAIQGRLVPQDNTEEPASELLKRIKAEKQKLVKEGKLKAKDITDSIIYKGDDNKYYEKCGNTLTCIDEEIIFDVPKGWELARLSNVAQIYTGNSISESEKKARYTGVSGREYVGTKDVGFDCSVQYNNGVAIPKQYESAFKIAPAYSVLMCIEGGSAGRKTAIIDRDICFGNKLCCFAPYVNISKYIFYYLQSPLFFEMFNSGKTGIIGGVSVNNVKNLLIPIPPYQEMQRIIDKLEQALASIMSR